MGESESDQIELGFARRALREIEQGKRNWLKRRDKNPGLFEQELKEAFENIKAMPAFGSPTTMTSRGKLVRRVEMDGACRRCDGSHPPSRRGVHSRVAPPHPLVLGRKFPGKERPLAAPSIVVHFRNDGSP